MTNYDEISKEIAEGRGRSTQTLKNVTSPNSGPSFPLFQRFVILDVVFDPTIIDVKKLDYWEHELKVTNIQHAVAAPRNAIIARRIQTNTSSPAEQAMVLYPFFPSNISLPAHPGEHVWVMFEDPSGTRKDLGYWMCRIVTNEHVEDVNHTHPHRAHDPSFAPSTTDLYNDTKINNHEFRNGSVGVQDGERYTIPETATLPGGDDAYVNLILNSDAGKLIQLEHVPRYKKKPADYALEGKNNTLIVLGTDRVSKVAAYSDSDTGQVPQISESDNINASGMIDLVVGRGQTPTTSGRTIKNSLGKSELDKTKIARTPGEGDPDFDSDRSRVAILQKSPIDQNFNLTQFNREFSDGQFQGGDGTQRNAITDDIANSPGGDGGIVVKSDKIRLIARSDIEIVVSGYERDENGKMVAISDPSQYCAIVLKPNGDIVLRPAALGYIKLGGDDADKAVVCSDLPATAENGIVTGAPMITTMGGQFAGAKPTPTGNDTLLSPGQGKFASKVLIK